MMSTEVLMPKLADTLVEGTLARWLKAAHEAVKTGEAIAEIETDKVTTELTAPSSGTLGKLLVTEGQTVPVGTPLVCILTTPAKRSSPLAARMAQAHGVDLSQVQATSNRITRADIERHLSKASPAPSIHLPATPTSASARSSANTDTLLPLTGLRRATAQRMALVHQIPTGSAVVEADMTGLEAGYKKVRAAWQEREGFPLTYTPYFIHALAHSLRAWPSVRMAYVNGQPQPREGVHVGVAVALDDGLIVPVLRDADQKDFVTLAREQADLVARARDHRLRPDEVTGGVATLTNVGSMGGLLALPMLNEKQAVILGLGAITRRAVSISNGIQYRSHIYLSLTFDRRVLDDLQAEHFLLDVAERIHSWIQ
ncbi:MAG: dihydrolipoamide acetyltransferase family protein [Ktedonobacteraceae bacterium]